jgi:hypothetical protein
MPHDSQSYTADISESGAVLFIDSDGNWLVGLVNSAVSTYTKIHTATADSITTNTLGLIPQSIDLSESGAYTLYFEDEKDGEFYSVEVSADGLLDFNDATKMSLDDIAEYEEEEGEDLDESGAIGDDEIVWDDGFWLDVSVTAEGEYVVTRDDDSSVVMSYEGTPIDHKWLTKGGYEIWEAIPDYMSEGELGFDVFVYHEEEGDVLVFTLDSDLALELRTP